jgi:uncharacterized repeat protein (TIGR03806 family)
MIVMRFFQRWGDFSAYCPWQNTKLRFKPVLLGLALLSFARVATAQPYGLAQPQPIGPYLNNVFPATAPNVSASWTVEVAFTNLTVDQPMFLTPYPGTNRLLVIRKPGQIVMFENRRSVSNAEVQVFLDIQSRVFTVSDSGMTGLAFHPEFRQPGSTNRGYFYVTYKWRPAGTANSEYAYWRLSRFTVPDGQMTADANSELVLIQQLDRQMFHDAGSLLFGQDGFLYFSIGDEGGGNDQYNVTQMLNERLFSGVFRIDVNRNPTLSHPIRRQPIRHVDTPATWPDPYTTNYFVPNSNPFVNPDGSVLEEFYALGLRQPYRISQDPVTGRIWIGESGQNTREEIDILEAGANYQWAYREGMVAGPKATPGTIIGTEKLPIWDYDRSYGGCIIGGYVYRGSEHAPELTGKYIAVDNVSGRITAVTYDGTNAVAGQIASMPSGSVYGGTSSCGLDANGEIYFLKFGDVGGGRIYKLAKILTTVPDPPPLLSQLGVFTNLAALQPGPGILPYTVNSSLWSDNAAKLRWLAVPNNGTHNTATERVAFSLTDEWGFPPGTVFIKHFELPVNDANQSIVRRLETRFLVMDQNGGSYGLTYRWRADGTDADLLTNGVTANYVVTNLNSTTRTQAWQFPSRQDCLTCHNANAKYVLGLKTHQLNGDTFYPQTGVTDNQLRALGHIGLFTAPYDEAAIPSYPKAQAVTNEAISLTTRVRSYIDANCAHCHRPGGVRAHFDARYRTPLEEQGLIYGPLDNYVNGPDDRVAVPGNVANSLMHLRPSLVGALQMPPLAKNVVDTNAMQVFADWINSLPTGPGVHLSLVDTNQTLTASPFAVAVEISESVTGLNSNMFVVGNGHVSSFTGSGGSYTVTIQPHVTGTVTVRLPAGVVKGASGDGNYASNLLPVTYDPLASVLATWLPFDDAIGTTAADASGHGNEGTLNNFGATPWVNGVSGTGLAFDGTNDFVNINNVVGTNFTIACWIKTTQVFPQVTPTYQGTGIIWSDVGGAANDFILGATRSSGGTNRLSFFAGNPDSTVSGVTPINSGNWTHIAVTRSGTNGEIRLYVNGVLDATGTGGANLLIANPVINIGGNTLDGRYFQGLIDDVRIYSRVLSGAEVASLVSTLPPPVAWYKLEANAVDSSGNLNHGTPANVTYSASRVDAYAAQFNGTNGEIQIPASVSNHITLAFWLKTTDTSASGPWPTGDGLVDGNISGLNGDFGTVLTSGKVAFGVGNVSSNYSITSLTSVNNGQWHHIAATRNATSGAMTLYVDGVPEANVIGPVGPLTSLNGLRIGRLNSGGGFLAGSLDEILLYDTVLNPSQIAVLAGPNTAPVLGSISNRTIIAGATMIVSNSVADPDAPPQSLTFSLVGAPSGVTINATNGLITWRPGIAQSPSVDSVIVKVSDSGSPSLSAIQSFDITVLQPTQPVFANPNVNNGTFSMNVSGDAGPDYSVYGSTNLVNWNLLMTTNPSTLPFLFTDPGATNFNQRFYRVLLGP